MQKRVVQPVNVKCLRQIQKICDEQYFSPQKKYLKLKENENNVLPTTIIYLKSFAHA